MIYRIISLLLVFTLPAVVSAEMTAFNCVKALGNSEGQKAITKLQARYSEVKGLSARFVQHSYLTALDTSELSQGQVIFSKPGKMKWIYHEPELQEFIADGKTLWFYQPIDEQVLVDNFESGFRGDLPVSFLLGIGDLTELFSLTKACNTTDGILLELLPKKKDTDEIGKVAILVDGKGWLPIGAQLYDPAGNKNSFLFSDLDTSKSFSDKEFVPKLPKGTDIIDNRKNTAKSN